MELVKVTTVFGGDRMAERKETLIERMGLKLDAFNDRLKIKVVKRQEVYNAMRAEKDYKKVFAYMKEFFSI